MHPSALGINLQMPLNSMLVFPFIYMLTEASSRKEVSFLEDGSTLPCIIFGELMTGQNYPHTRKTTLPIGSTSPSDSAVHQTKQRAE